MSTTATLPAGSDVGARTISKMRRRLMPFLVILFIVAMLDRVNIGFAQDALRADLGIDPAQFGNLAGIFFIGYFLLEVPSNLMLHRVGARIWIARILITWGFIAAATGFAQTLNQLYVIRFLLGMAEAGFMPGVVLYLTYWFPQKDRAGAVALFMLAHPISTMIGAPVSGLILDHIHWMGLASWRWMLILEAVPAVILGVITYKFLPSKPKDAKFLTQEEKDWLIDTMERENAAIASKSNSHGSVKEAFTNLRVWFFAIIYFLNVIGIYAFNFWFPHILKELKKLSSTGDVSYTLVGLLGMIPPIFGLIVMLILAKSSDRKQEHCWHAGLPLAIGGLATMLIGGTSSITVAIACLALMAAGIYNFYGPFWVLPSKLLVGYAAASGIALINSVGNLGGYVSPKVIGYITTKHNGDMFWGMVFAGSCMVLSGIMTIACKKIDKKL